jgi:hypothetical protein
VFVFELPPYREAMLSNFICVLTFNGERNLFIPLLMFLAAVLYQLVSGTLLWVWSTSTTRENRPGLYWGVVIIELVLVLLGLLLETLYWSGGV